MKYLLNLLLIGLSFNACHGQITLEKTFSDSEFVVSQSGYFGPNPSTEYLITFDENNQSLNFYDSDYRLYKSVTNFFDGNAISCMPTYLSRNLFNSDNKLEFIALTSNKDGVNTIKLINEDGRIIKDFGSAASAYCIKIKNKIKLLVNKVEISYDPTNPGATYTSELYSVPGSWNK